MAAILFVIVIGASIWVAVDASNLGVKRGSLGGGFADMGPTAWFFATLLIWIIGFPLYLATRPKYVARRRQKNDSSGPAMAMSPSILSNGPLGRMVRKPEPAWGQSLVGRQPMGTSNGTTLATAESSLNLVDVGTFILAGQRGVLWLEA